MTTTHSYGPLLHQKIAPMYRPSNIILQQTVLLSSPTLHMIVFNFLCCVIVVLWIKPKDWLMWGKCHWHTSTALITLLSLFTNTIILHWSIFILWSGEILQIDHSLYSCICKSVNRLIADITIVIIHIKQEILLHPWGSLSVSSASVKPSLSSAAFVPEVMDSSITGCWKK